MTRIISLGITALLGVSLSAGLVAAANPIEYLAVDRPNYALGLGFDFETGDYGLGNQSDFLSVPFYLDLYPTDRIDVGVVIPYLYQRMDQNGSSTIFYRSQSGYSGGAVVQSQTGKAAGNNDSANNSNNSVSGINATAETAEAANHRVSESGLGDVTLTVGYALVKESLSNPLIKPTFYLKIPTADEDRGLGSGEFDFGPGLTLGKWFDSWYLFAEGLYVIQGETSFYDTKDYLSYNVSVGRQTGENFYVALVARGMTAPAEGSGDLLEGRLKGVWWMMPDVSLEGYLGTGFSNHSTDFTSSVAVFFSF